MRFNPSKLRMLRLNSKETQKDLAVAIGTRQAVVSHWERGEWVPGTPFLMALAVHYDVNMDYFFLRYIHAGG